LVSIGRFSTTRFICSRRIRFSLLPELAALTAAGSEARFTEVFYFSLSALTTIGSSNEEQLSTMVRQLAVVESAMGQLYLAVLISRLVGFSTTSDAKAAS